MATTKWIKTNSNASIFQCVLPNGANNIVLLKVSGVEKSNAEKIGFKSSRNGSFIFREGGKFSLKEMKGIFPRCEVVDLEEELTKLKVNSTANTNQDAPKEKPVETNADDLSDDKKAIIESNTNRLIGTNYLGQEVFEDASMIRFIAIGDQAKNMSSEKNTNFAVYLRASNDVELSLCADAFIERLLMGEKFRPADVIEFANIVMAKDDEKILATDSRVRGMQEAIETSLFKKFAEKNPTLDAHEFSKAIDVESNQPSLTARTSNSIELQQYSTPLAMSFAVQSILKNLVSEPTKILEPAIGNASLVSHFKHANLTGYEIDKARAALSTVSGVNRVINQDFLKAPVPNDKYDVVIGNPPFGGLPAPVIMEDMKVTRIDQLFLMKSLGMRKDEGAMAFIIGGDYEAKMTGQDGKILGGSKNLFNYLADHYRMTAFEVDGAMYGKQGANFPVRVVVVGAKYSPEEIKKNHNTLRNRIDVLPTVKTYNELWMATDTARLFIESNVNIPIYTNEKAETKDDEVKLTAAAEIEANPLQTVYKPLSRIGEPSSLIPSHLEGSLKKAFDRLTNDVGDIDTFVAKALGKKEDELSALYTPEQIDAIALGIWNIQRGRALILADETGQGKGRILAAIVQWATLNEQKPMFLTEKGGLFSSIWRDIQDSGGQDLVTPLIINKGAKIIDMNTDGEVLFKSATAPELDMIFNEEADSKHTIMATYSQFNRPVYKLERAKWIAEERYGGVLILDEAHNAAGDSNVGNNISNAVTNAGGAIYSSATFAKGAKNFSVYKKAFPPSVNLDSLKETLEVGGEPLLEILSAMLAEDGTLIRRESDLSQLTIETHYPNPEMEAKNRELAIAYSVVMQAMSELSGEIEQFARTETNRLKKEFNKSHQEIAGKNKAGNIGVANVGFGSRLATLNRQFLLSLAVPSAIEYAKERVALGEKPVFALEHTMEGLVGDVMGRDEDDEELTEDDAEEAALRLESAEDEMAPIQFRDLFNRTLNRMMDVVVNNGYGVTKHHDFMDVEDSTLDAEERAAQREHKVNTVQKLRDIINAFPDLSANPIDDINNAMADIGLSAGEISGRKSRIAKGDNGQYEVQDLPKLDKATIEYRFNSGAYDSLVLSRAGSTGISLHSSNKFTDQRRRCLIEVQGSLDVVQRKQMFGRVNRRGQVCIPRITSIVSGLPLEVRMMSMQNAKLRALSANTRSNRESNDADNTPDILNEIGELACQQYLQENPSIANMLRIDLAGSETVSNYFVNKLTGRISLLHPDEQEKIFKEIFANYEQTLKELTNRGENPLEVNALDVKARVVESFNVTEKAGESVFDNPVVASRIVWTEKKDVIRGEKAMLHAARGRESLISDTRFEAKLSDGYLSRMNVAGEPIGEASMTSFKNLAKVGFDGLLVQSLPSKYLSEEKSIYACIRDAIADGNTAMQGIESRREWLNTNLTKLTPYHVIEFNHMSEKRTGLIVGITPPNAGEEHYLGRWSVKVAVTGETAPLELSLNQLKNDEMYSPLHYYKDNFDEIIQMLNSPDNTDQETERSKWVLSGNLFKASELAASNALGKAGYYSDEHGVNHRAILCQNHVNKDDFNRMQSSVSNADDAAILLMAQVKHKEFGVVKFNEACHLSWKNGVVSITVGGSKQAYGDVYLDFKVIKAVGEFSGNRKEMQAVFNATPSNMKELMIALYRNNVYLKEVVKSPELTLSENSHKNDAL